LVPAGATFLSGSFTLRGGMEFRLEHGARILASPHKADYTGYAVPDDPNAVEGEKRVFISAHQAHDLAITGGGTIDGNAKAFMTEELRLHDRGVAPACRGEASLTACARAVGVSLRTLQARCAVALGHGPAEELLRLRLDRAARLLAETDLPLKAVAHRTGFASAAYLCTAFSRERGMTPGTWRKQQSGAL